MIHRFSVSNFHSVRDEVTLDLRIPGTAPDLPRFRSSGAKPDVRLPTVVVFMGPNGSGKTTLLRALTAMASVATGSLQNMEVNYINAIVPFAAEPNLREPTRFCVEVEADWMAPGEAPQLYRYELAVERDRSDFRRSVFRYEALSHFPRGRPRRIFERVGPGEPLQCSGPIAKALGLGSKARPFRAIRDDASAVGALALLNVPLVTRLAEWLQSLGLATNVLIGQTWTPPTQVVVSLLRGDAAMMTWAQRHLESSDLGVRGVEVREATRSDEEASRSVWFDQDGPVAQLPLLMQSGGTQRLFHLLPQLYIALQEGVPAVLDEVDADLHVDIVADMLRWFWSPDSNPNNAQLLVTAHNVGLLDDLEKEELFVVEKTRDGATRVHGAQDVRGLRRDARLYPKYRAGVLGGVPKIG